LFLQCYIGRQLPCLLLPLDFRLFPMTAAVTFESLWVMKGYFFNILVGMGQRSGKKRAVFFPLEGFLSESSRLCD
jgi:hypothetical protein